MAARLRFKPPVPCERCSHPTLRADVGSDAPEPDAAVDDRPGVFDDFDEFEPYPAPAPEPPPLELHRVLEGGHAPLSRFVGSRVELHSLQARKELNGRQGMILPMAAMGPPPHDRVPVLLDGGDPPAVMVRPENIRILQPEEESDSDSGTDEGPAPSAAAPRRWPARRRAHRSAHMRTSDER